MCSFVFNGHVLDLLEGRLDLLKLQAHLRFVNPVGTMMTVQYSTVQYSTAASGKR